MLVKIMIMVDNASCKSRLKDAISVVIIQIQKDEYKLFCRHLK